jgi:cytidylate kinase
MPITIAIDGPASSGKGTIARQVAQRLGYAYVDTGAMYRAVALKALESGIPWSESDRVAQLAAGLDFGFTWAGGDLQIAVDGRDISRDIRQEHIGRGASDVAVHPPVRAALLERQRSLGARGGVVMDGRDIGTVVLPEAQLKVFLDASLQERARRRHGELVARLGPAAPSLDEVETELRARDAQDRGRKTAPLRQAEDAVYVDSTRLSPREVCAQVVELAESRGARRP